MGQNDRSAIYKTELTALKILWSGGDITGVSFASQSDGDDTSAISDRTAAQIGEYLRGERRDFDLPLKLRGTDFQVRVWEELRRIPYGETRSYGQIAAAVGSPKASRAVGMACNRNPVAIVVPCHRVVGAGGKLVGYAGGLDIKRRLLELESRSKTERK